jgi:hypothetical protein
MNATEGIQYLKAKPAAMPVFCILASDPDGARTVRHWACLRMNRPDPKGKIDEALRVAGAMDAWRTRNDVLDDICMDGWSIVPVVEDAYRLACTWCGAFICGALFTLAVFAVWATR